MPLTPRKLRDSLGLFLFHLVYSFLGGLGHCPRAWCISAARYLGRFFAKFHRSLTAPRTQFPGVREKHKKSRFFMRARRSGFGTSVRKSRIEPMCTRICSFQTQVLVLPQGRVFRTAGGGLLRRFPGAAEGVGGRGRDMDASLLVQL